MPKHLVPQAVTYSELEMSDLTRQFSLDTLDDWTTMAGLVETATTMMKGIIAQSECYFFVHVPESKEYREINKEGLAAIPEESLFIACLSMQNDALSLTKFFEDFFINEPLLMKLLLESYNAQWIIPVGHRFNLLAFILVSFKQESRPHSFLERPTEEEEYLLKPLLTRLRINLYAAFIADTRQRNLLTMAEFPLRLREFKTIDELINHMPQIIGQSLSYDCAVYYEYDEFQQVLRPRAWDGLQSSPVSLKKGEGLSGFVFEKKRAFSVPDRSQHISFSSMTDEDFIQGSFISAPLFTNKKDYGVLTLSRNKTAKEAYASEQRYTLEIAVAFMAAEIDSRMTHQELEQSYLTTIASLIKALEAKDQYTKGHSERVMELSVGMAELMNLSPASIRKIKYAAILHDIGKIGIRDSIITKQNKLSKKEFREIKKHPEIGFDILDKSGFMGEIRYLIRYHHEKMDGSGYYGKNEDEYPWEDQLISLADIFDALTTNRSYRKAMKTTDALDILEKLVGVQFNQKIYTIFLEYLKLKNSNR